MSLKLVLSVAMGLAAVPAAYAQTAAAPEASATPAAPAAAAPATGAAAAGASYSDEQVDKYAKALAAVNKVNADPAIAAADKQPKMLAAVHDAGVDPQTFNQMSQAMQADPALQKRIMAATATH